MSLYYNMLFGFSVGDLIAVSQRAWSIYGNSNREIDDVKREIDSLCTNLRAFLRECEQLDYSRSQGSLYETRLLTQTVSDCGTTLKQLEQLLKNLKFDHTTSRRISQLERRLYASQWNIERLQKDLLLCVSHSDALSLAQRCLRVPDDASAFLRSLIEGPIDVPISDAAGSMDNTHIIYRSDKDWAAMRTARKWCLEGRDNSLSKLLWAQPATACGKSTLARALIKGVCTNIVDTYMCYSYGLGDQELCDNSISTISTNHRSQDSYCLHGLVKGAIMANSFPSETRSSLNDLYHSCTICGGTFYISPFSRHKDFSYGSWANLSLVTTSITSSNIWSDDTPRQWFFRRWSLQRLGHAMSSVSLRTSKVLTLVSPIFFTSPASAEASHCGSQNDPVRLKTGPHDYSSWFQALDNVQRDLLYVSCFFIPSF